MKHLPLSSKARKGFVILLVGIVCIGCPTLLGASWSRFLGESADDVAYAIAKTTDGGYILAGYSEASVDVSNNAHLIKITSLGLVQWEADYGDALDDEAYSVAQTTDGGYILAGQFGSERDDSAKAFLIKTDSSGVETWRKLFSEGTHSNAINVVQTKDGGYLLAVELDALGSSNAAMIKTDSSGVEQWRSVGAEGTHAVKALQTKDGGYVMASWSLVYGDKKTSASGKIALRKTDATGQQTWEQSLTDDDAIELGDMIETSDSGLMLVGQIDFLGEDSQVLMWKTDSLGSSVWRKTYGSDGRSEAHAVREISDGDFVLTGETLLVGAQSDVFLLRTDSSGDAKWLRFYGGEDRDIAYDVVEATSGGFLIAGLTESADAENEVDNSEVLLIKTNSAGHCEDVEIEE
jgi:hypothetical protein